MSFNNAQSLRQTVLGASGPHEAQRVSEHTMRFESRFIFNNLRQGAFISGIAILTRKCRVNLFASFFDGKRYATPSGTSIMDIKDRGS
jgi:hypothetical protein